MTKAPKAINPNEMFPNFGPEEIGSPAYILIKGKETWFKKQRMKVKMIDKERLRICKNQNQKFSSV